jgi:hypothetical protein
MSTQLDFGEAMAQWADRNATISGLVLIGSRAHQDADQLLHADAYSDWDFQVIASKPKVFENASWTKGISGFELRAYAVRTAIIGGVPKINAVFSNAEADFVIIPTISARLLRLCILLGLHRTAGRVRRHVQDLAEVIRPGWRFLKGGDRWGNLYRRAVEDVTDPRLSDEDVRQLAEGFVCDYIWIVRKIARGELRAAQRILYRELLEVNLRLLHELRLRRGQPSFTKARRLEKVTRKDELESVTIEAILEVNALQNALEKSAVTFRGLMQALVRDTWQWPDSTLRPIVIN